MDQIIEQFMRNFKETNGVNIDTPNKLFEAFTNYCIGSQSFIGDFDFEDISTNGQGEIGIDGIAIVVNEHLVLSESDVDYFKKTLGRLDVRFIFIQSKTSPKFDLGDMIKFFFGVQNFFKSSTIHQNEKIKRFHEIKEYIYECAIEMEKSPECELFYVTTGEWASDKNLLQMIHENIESLKSTKLFDTIDFSPIDAEGLKKIYRSLRSKIQKTIKFERHTILPSIDRVGTAYIGIIPSSEYIKLITNDDEKLDRRLFYDNVRDFQGNNPVNLEIAQTLQDNEKKGRFALLNNGVTIVAKFANQTGATFNIRDFQIVNGCQTSHVLYNNRQFLNDEIYLPIKLIITEDPDIANSITQATNSQTEVKKEAFEALSPFHKRLEEFYESFSDINQKLYYERRSKQYDDITGVKPERIISLSTQLKCFFSMFANNPHSAHRYYGDLLEKHSPQLFRDSHALYPYYVSSYAFYVLEKLFSNKKLDHKYKLFRYHIILIFRTQNEPESLPPLNNIKKIDKYCQQLAEILWDEQRALSAFQSAINALNLALREAQIPWIDAANRKAFTEAIINIAKRNSLSENAGAVATVEREIGKVVRFGNGGFGFIQTGDTNQIFVHWKYIRGSGYKFLTPGAWVSYVKSQGDRGDIATDVETLGHSLVVFNETNHPVTLAIRYKHHSGNWTTDGWWDVDANDVTSGLITDEELEAILTEATLYYYAEATDESNWIWMGEHSFDFEDDNIMMIKTSLYLNSSGEYVLNIKAENSILVEE